MPSGSVLAPSKGALRILRSIAYATSAGTALIIEERRRRISSLQKVCDNAKRLRGCRRYCSSGVTEDNQSPLARLEKKWSEEPVEQLPKGRKIKTTDADVDEVPSANDDLQQAESPSGRVSWPIHRLQRAGVERINKEYYAEIGRASAERNRRSRGGESSRPSRWTKVLKDFLELSGRENATWFQGARQLVVSCKRHGYPDIADQIRGDLVMKSSWGFKEEIDRLLKERKVEEAVDMFDWLCQGKKIVTGGHPLRAVNQIFRTAVNSQKYFLAEKVFRRVHSLGHQDLSAWVTLLEAYDRKKDYNAVLRLYKDLCKDYATHGLAVTIALRALIVRCRLEEAETLMNEALERSELRLSSCLTTLLGGIWKKTRDLPRTTNLFERMETMWFEKHPPSPALFNTLIQACVEAGRLDQAQLFKSVMNVKYGIADNVKTDAHSTFLLAKEGDWQGVEAKIQENTEKRGIPFRTSDFNAWLLECTRTAPLAIAEGLLMKAIHNHKIKPDVVTINIIINAFLKASDVNSAVRWIEYMKTFGLRPDTVTFNTILHKLWKDSRIHHNELFHVYNEVFKLDRSLISTRTEDIIRHAMAYDGCHKGPSSLRKSKFKTLVNCEVDTSREMDTQTAHSKMIIALAMGENEVGRQGVLALYETAKAKGTPISPGMFETAYDASFKLGKSYKKIRREIRRSAGEAGVAPYTLIPFRIDRLPKRLRYVHSYLDHIYRIRDRACLPVEHFTAVTAAYELLKRDRPEDAAYLLIWVMRSEWGARQPLQIAGWTVVLDAFAAYGNIEGVNSVLQQVIERGITLDTYFLRRVKAVREKLVQNPQNCQEENKAVTERKLENFDQLRSQCLHLFFKRRLEFRGRMDGVLGLFAQARQEAVEAGQEGDVPLSDEISGEVGEELGDVDRASDSALLVTSTVEKEETASAGHVLVEESLPRMLAQAA